jgi:2-polyprenyl-6-methoxyphenol hydroxylase-like FAD-dependent oxidoreductase
MRVEIVSKSLQNGNVRIAVVGAGPAGAALSLLLARGGAEVLLVERETDFERVFRGEGLMPLGLEMLHQMGFRERLRDLPGHTLDAWDIYLNGVRIMHIDEPSRELGDLALRIVSQTALLSSLIEEAKKHPAFVFRPGASVRDLLRDGDRVAGLLLSTPAGEETLAADLVIGTDGRASLIRKRAGLELRLLNESYDVLWFKLPLPKALEGTNPIQIFASGSDAMLAYRSWDGRWQLAWMLPKGGWRRARERDWLADCAALLPEPFSEHLLSHREALMGPSLLDVMVGRCPRWHVPGLLLLGDAAHPMSPIRAQGINMALRDAVVAANHLVPTLRAGGDVGVALAAIQREREPEIAKAQTLQYREARGQRWARERPWLMKPMLALVPWMMRSAAFQGFIQTTWLRQQRPLRMGIADVRLRV